MTVRFLHISDTHISSDPAFSNYGHRPYDNLKRLIATINALPYSFDFVLHTGDVVEDASTTAYQQAKHLFSDLRAPIYYLSGNHDHAPELQRVLLDIQMPKDRYDYAFVVGGVQFVVLDSRGPIDPGGELTSEQIAWLGEYCTPDGPPLVIALHHEPIPLDVPWLDEITFMASPMLLRNSAEFIETLKPAQARLRGVFFGHIHRGIQVVQDGLLFSSAPSVFAQLKTWPNLRAATPAPEEAVGYCLVTIDEQRTLIQQYTFARPA